MKYLSVLFLFLSFLAPAQDYDFVKDAFALPRDTGHNFLKELKYLKTDSAVWVAEDSIGLIYHFNEKHKIYATQYISCMRISDKDSLLVNHAYFLHSRQSQNIVFRKYKSFGYRELTKGVFFKVYDNDFVVFLTKHLTRFDKKEKVGYNWYKVLAVVALFDIENHTLKAKVNGKEISVRLSPELEKEFSRLQNCNCNI